MACRWHPDMPCGWSAPCRRDAPALCRLPAPQCGHPMVQHAHSLIALDREAYVCSLQGGQWQMLPQWLSLPQGRTMPTSYYCRLNRAVESAQQLMSMVFFTFAAGCHRPAGHSQGCTGRYGRAGGATHAGGPWGHRQDYQMKPYLNHEMHCEARPGVISCSVRAKA